MKYSVVALFILIAGIDLIFSQADTLRLHQLQVIGSHNSYKQAIAPELFRFLEEKDTTGGMLSLQYEHIAITEQLDMGLRNLELDIYIDDKGGRYARPKGLELVEDQPEYDPEGKMEAPGFKMLHVPDIDFRSEYLTLEDCLKALRKWSFEHPSHEPVFITLEAKDGKANHFGTKPEPFTEKAFAALDSVLLNDLGKDHLITPDGVRGNYTTLEAAVLDHQWPVLKEARGKFLFILDDKGRKKELYRKGHPSLRNRVLFVCAEPGTPEAGAMILNNPDDPRIPELVRKGYIIRTRADANTKEARNNDYSGFEAAKKSGSQIITTDYYLPSRLFRSSYHIMFGGNRYVRENPVSVSK
ncbi:phosphatidylinositol-specific phospholipase C1-like protein [Sinomicrobium kalidii]|uniref:phosphatidylinositol-specific phospholipase C1-like protein n=1 Tax=Sinomicrobium kalidii TaxID=2900738 RepID=UPI001E57A73C|nr:phosphatidylinositol-specific phospholipase C1-like protein [Sinomicrobium kalidii]UGU16851.1 phosphatidylinositol-specific phospholipase C1-like protein [Sinomicrobium kalidii]